MKPIHILAFLILITKSCTCTENIAEFTKDELSLFSYYQNNEIDTIFFESNNKDLDTILFENIDFLLNNVNSVMSYPHRKAMVQVFYLPFPNIYNYTSYNYSDSIPAFPSFIFKISKDNGITPVPSISIDYRGFRGDIKFINKTQKDSLLSEFKISEYWLVESSDLNGNNSPLEKIIWTREFGLTSYFLKSGDYYKIKL